MSYTPTIWNTGDIITADKLNNIEDGIVNAKPDLFYVFHSSDATLEAIPIPDNDRRFDLTTKVSEGCFYGGYYHQCGSLVPESENIVSAMNLASQAIGDRIVVQGADSYDGSVTKDSSGTVFWKKANAYICDVDDTTGIRGNYMIPIKNQVYFIREVPNIYDNIGMIIYTVGGVVRVDLITLADSVYWHPSPSSSTQYPLIKTPFSDNLEDILYGGLASSYVVGGTGVSISYADFQSVVHGYIGHADVASFASQAGTDDVTFTSVKITQDGVVVYGRDLTINFGDGSTDPTTGVHAVYKFH